MKMKSLAVLVAVLTASPAWSQFQGFPQKSYWNQMWQSPQQQVEIEPISQLRDFVEDGSLTLSLDRYIELVMANHGDINASKLSVYSQENLVQAALSPFDPSFTASFSAQRSTTPSSDQLDGAAISSSLSQIGRATFSKTFDTGSELDVDYVTNRNSSNSQFRSVNPALNQSFGVRLSQPLLRGRGRKIQRIDFIVAETRLDQTEEQVRQQIIGLISQAENIYWNAVQQRESLSVQQNNLQLAQSFLERSRRELELGAISPLDIYQPEQQFANAQVFVTQARYALQRAEDAIRRWVGADLNPDFRDMPILLTESADPPENPPTFDEEETVALAMRLRPELSQQRLQLDIDDLNIRQSTNQLRPDLSLNARYTSQGLGGNTLILDDNNNPIGVISGGLGDAWNQLFSFRFPVYSVGLTLELPLRNRRAAATLANDTIAKKRDLYDLRSTEQDIRLDVVQAVAGIEQAKASVRQAVEARRFSQLRLDAEQQKYDLGVSTAFLVLQAQDGLIQSENSLLNQSINYRRALTALYQATGDLLNQRNVQIQYN